MHAKYLWQKLELIHWNQGHAGPEQIWLLQKLVVRAVDKQCCLMFIID